MLSIGLLSFTISRMLRGEEIPLAARIMALADVFDALTSRRTYKDAMPVENAFAIIRAEQGRQFDPVLAAIFLTLQPHLAEIAGRFADA
jgi:putative two-component system response regulator